MKTRFDGERNYCSYCGRELIEVSDGTSEHTRVKCPKWGKGFLKLDFNHDNFFGQLIPHKNNYDPLTGKRNN